MLKSIKTFFKSADKKEDLVLLKKVKAALLIALTYGYENYGALYACQIHLIEIDKKDGVLIVKITLGKPGALIGVRGENIDRINKHIEQTLQRKVKISIEEFDPFK